jgi:hypothetical protein
MRKVLLPILYISLIAPILFGAFDAKALHNREISWCEFAIDANVIDLQIDTGTKQKLQTIKAGTKIETSKEKDEIMGNVVLVVARAYGSDLDPTHYPDYGDESQTSLSSIWSEINKEKDRFNEICGRSSTGVRKKSVIQTYNVAECTIGNGGGEMDSFNVGGFQQFGINIEFMNLWMDSKEILGLKASQYINNLPGTFSVFVRSYDANTGVYSIGEDTVSSDSNNALTIRHNADHICNVLNESESSISVSSPSGPPPPSSGGRGTPTIFQGDGPGTSGGVGGGGAAGTAQIQEGCNVERRIEFKDGDTTISFEENEFVGPGNDRNTGKWGVVCVVNTVNTIADWAFFILISVAFVFILIAGFLWMTGRGEAEKMKKAGQMIGAALVGIVIALLSRVIPGVITGILT